MGLQLKPDLEYVQRSYAEPVDGDQLDNLADLMCMTYRDTKPATPPAITTCRWEPYGGWSIAVQGAALSPYSYLILEVRSSTRHPSARLAVTS